MDKAPKRILKALLLAAGAVALTGCSTSIMLLHSTSKYSLHDMNASQVQACLGAPTSKHQDIWTYVKAEHPAPNQRKFKKVCTVRVYWNNGLVDKVTYNGRGYLSAMAANECYGMRRICRKGIKNPKLK